MFKAIIFVDPQRQHYEFENKDYGVLKCNLLAKAIQHNNWNLAKILLDDNGARLDVNSDVIMKVEDKETKKHEDHVLSPLHLAIMKKHNDMVWNISFLIFTSYLGNRVNKRRSRCYKENSTW